MSEAFILCGLPFSGKSHLAAQISEIINVTVVSFDDIKKEIFPSKMVMENQDWQAVKSIALKRYEAALANGESVIWDSTNPLKVHRQELIELAKRYGAQETIVYLNIPSEIIHSRRERNVEIPTRHQVAEKEFFKTVDIWEEPTDAEGNLIVLSSNEAVEQFFLMFSSGN